MQERAAQKRVARGLEKLRAYFARRGVVIPAAAIAGALAAHSVQAAPAVLVKSIVAQAASTGAAASGSLFLWVKGALKVMVWTKAKTAVTAIVAAAVLTPVVVWQVHEGGRLFAPRLSAQEASEAQKAARTFFQACEKADWEQAAALYPESAPPGRHFDDVFNDRLKGYLGGLKVVNLGKPFRDRSYAGIFVPYEIRFKDGQVKKFRLAVRQDNPERRWYFDGGL